MNSDRVTWLELAVWLAMLALIAVCLSYEFGCAATANVPVETMVGLQNRVTKAEATIGTMQTTIGGGVDSVALSLAIVALGVSPFAGAWYYERFRRPKRLAGRVERRHGDRRVSQAPGFIYSGRCRRNLKRRRQ